MDSVFTPKNNREKDLKSGVDPRLSTIVETGQSNDDTINNSQSRERYVNGKSVPSGNGAHNEEENVEPQYENLMKAKMGEEDNYIDPNVPDENQMSQKHIRQIPKETQQKPSNSLYEDTGYYIDPNIPETTLQDADKRQQVVKNAGERDTDLFYENLQTTQSYGNITEDDQSAIYQNDEGREASEAFYEDPMPKDGNDIYVDMA